MTAHGVEFSLGSRPQKHDFLEADEAKVVWTMQILNFKICKIIQGPRRKANSKPQRRREE